MLQKIIAFLQKIGLLKVSKGDYYTGDIDKGKKKKEKQ